MLYQYVVSKKLEGFNWSF